jgi:hypothetical protein
MWIDFILLFHNHNQRKLLWYHNYIKIGVNLSSICGSNKTNKVPFIVECEMKIKHVFRVYK